MLISERRAFHNPARFFRPLKNIAARQEAPASNTYTRPVPPSGTGTIKDFSANAGCEIAANIPTKVTTFLFIFNLLLLLDLFRALLLLRGGIILRQCTCTSCTLSQKLCLSRLIICANRLQTLANTPKPECAEDAWTPFGWTVERRNDVRREHCCGIL